ncbi:hypothetical protein Tco_0173529 [Tanacetum coccineum]
MQEVIAFYKGLDGPTRLSLDSRGVVPAMNAIEAKKAIQEMAKYSQKWHDESSNRKKGTKTSDGIAAIQAQVNNLGREFKKMNERVYAAQEGYEICKGPHYTKDCQFKAAVPGYYQRNNGNPSYQERRQSFEESVSKFMTKSARRHEENSNLIKEIRAATDSAIRNQGASIKALEIQIGQMSKSIATVESEIYSIRRIEPSRYASDEGDSEELHNLHVDRYVSSILEDDLPRKEKDPGSFTLPCYINKFCFNKALADLGPSLSVMPYSAYLTLGLGDLVPTKLIVELAYRTIKHPKGIAENVLVAIDKFTFFVDFVVLDPS